MEEQGVQCCCPGVIACPFLVARHDVVAQVQLMWRSSIWRVQSLWRPGCRAFVTARAQQNRDALKQVFHPCLTQHHTSRSHSLWWAFPEREQPVVVALHGGFNHHQSTAVNTISAQPSHIAPCRGSKSYHTTALYLCEQVQSQPALEQSINTNLITQQQQQRTTPRRCDWAPATAPSWAPQAAAALPGAAAVAQGVECS